MASQPERCAGPPAASSMTPPPQAPSAENPNPSVECSASVAPRLIFTALAVVPVNGAMGVSFERR